MYTPRPKLSSSPWPFLNWNIRKFLPKQLNFLFRAKTKLPRQQLSGVMWKLIVAINPCYGNNEVNWFTNWKHYTSEALPGLRQKKPQQVMQIDFNWRLKSRRWTVWIKIVNSPSSEFCESDSIGKVFFMNIDGGKFNFHYFPFLFSHLTHRAIQFNMLSLPVCIKSGLIN